MRQLSLRAEQTQSRLESAQREYALNPCDSLDRLIHELEKQNVAIQKAIERVQCQQQEAPTPAPSEQVTEESDVVVESPETTEPTPPAIEPAEPTTTPVPEVVSEPEVEVVDEERPQKEQPHPEIVVSDNLKLLFNTSRRRYLLTQGEISTLVEEYAKAYGRVEEALKGYEEATSLQTLEEHYAGYLAAMEEAGRIADQVVERGDKLLESKHNTYAGFADSLGIDTLHTRHLALNENVERSMSEKLAGRCSDIDLAMYPHRLRNTLLFEAELAHIIEPEVADSLMIVAQEYDCTRTLFAPLGAPKRADAKFVPIKIKKNAKESSVASLPVLKIPAKGEIYSITVANYASLPPSTKVFRGATPLYRERREDGRTYVYLGLYPTARSAQDDIALLRKVGFKQPTLVMWRDGIRRDDFVDRNTASAAPKSAMFRVEIMGVEGALPAKVQEIIKAKAPRKEISKYTSTDGSVVFTVGIFTKENEAKNLSKALSQSSPTLTTKVVQLGKK